MTISIKIKEIMNNMPDTLNTKKEIDDYYKDAMKKTMENNKQKEDKPKKELNAYQKFMKENIAIVKEKNSNLTGPEVFSLIATMWKKQKESNVTVVVSEAEPVKECKKETKDVVDDISDIKEVKEETKEVKKKEKKVK